MPDEIEVTPEMIAAGGAVLKNAVSGMSERWIEMCCVLLPYVPDVYRAMRALEPKAKNSGM
jgi:hypothetical protein